ncbi:MAG: PEGA domain-containing protein [Deltaproteobacteria bacterium]|nr:PEGA domain-containing protein [Deltaproteobacteria bacterium]
MSLALVAVMANDSLGVQVVSLSDRSKTLRSAGDLAMTLMLDKRLRLGPPMRAGGTVDDDEPLRRAALSMEKARNHYQQLDAKAALAVLTQAEVELRTWLDLGAEARALLAETLHIKGLVLLFLDRSDAAASAFASSSFLDPEFSPPAEDWPPQARLLYGDTLATLRQAAPGALSVQVTPDFARVYIDGSEAGLGSTTVPEIAPGEHQVLVTCPGYARFAGAVGVDGEGKLNDAPVFLQAHGEAEQREAAVRALIAAWDTADEEVVARQFTGLFAVDYVVVVAPDSLTETTAAPALAWLVGADGRRRGGAVPLASSETAALELFAPVWGAQDAALATPWYHRWYVWAAAGAAAAAVGGVVVWKSLDDRPRYRDIVLGRNP